MTYILVFPRELTPGDRLPDMDGGPADWPQIVGLGQVTPNPETAGDLQAVEVAGRDEPLLVDAGAQLQVWRD